MTTLIEDLQALLNPLAAGGSWYGINTAQPPVFPYIVFQRIASSPNVAMTGASALQNTRVQVDIYAQQISQAVTIESAVEAAFAAWAVTNVPVLSQDFYEDAVRAYRVSKDYSVWATN